MTSSSTRATTPSIAPRGPRACARLLPASSPPALCFPAQPIAGGAAGRGGRSARARAHSAASPGAPVADGCDWLRAARPRPSGGWFRLRLAAPSPRPPAPAVKVPDGSGRRRIPPYINRLGCGQRALVRLQRSLRVVLQRERGEQRPFPLPR